MLQENKTVQEQETSEKQKEEWGVKKHQGNSLLIGFVCVTQLDEQRVEKLQIRNGASHLLSLRPVNQQRLLSGRQTCRH
jgi:hypothetical protein